MEKEEVIKLFELNQDSQGIEYWAKTPYSKQMKSYGIGLTKLKKMAKEIGHDHRLALQLWHMPVIESKTMSTLIDEPSEIDEQQVEDQIDETGFWLLSHSYCTNLMPNVKFLKRKAVEWIDYEDNLRRRCGFLLLYQLAKNDKNLEDIFFDPYLDMIEEDIQDEENFVKDAMNNALLMIGQRSKHLHTRALVVAKRIGKIEVDYGDNSCKPADVLKHLTSEQISSKFK